MLKKAVRYSKSLPTRREFPLETILLYDKKTTQHRFIKSWLGQFKYKIALNAGESLKALQVFEKILGEVQKIVQNNDLGGSNLTFVGVGGGSVGDFVGFLAATYQRGRRLVFIPTTWLAALDSAHGGKNGLNLNAVKNQIGTFYSPEKIYIVEKVLKSLPETSLNDSFAEALKISMINRPQKFYALEKTASSLYRHLPDLISGKYQIVEQDPFEKKGLRKLLNLGHTMGHVFESVYKIPHGQAVFLGILFSLRFSLKRKYLKWHNFELITEKLFSIDTPMTYQQAIHLKLQVAKAILTQDKKRVSKGIDFIFVRSLGKTFIKTITMKDLLYEIQRQQREL